MCLEIIYLIYMYKEYLAINNQQWLIGHKTQPNQTLPRKNRFCVRPNTNKWYIFLPLLKSNRLIGPVSRVFANDSGDLSSIPVCIIPKTLKIVLDTSWLNTGLYKVHIKGKMEQSKERSCALLCTSV